MAEREGTVFIAEEVAHGKPYWFPATFRAHWEAPRGAGFRDGPEGVPAEEAIAWGRTQADRVLVRLADSDYYSAGSQPVGDRQPWPEGRVVEPRREPGMEHLDLVTEEPIAWDVRLPRWISRERADADARRLRAALEADPETGRVRVGVERGERVEAILRFTVDARSHTEAVHAAEAVERRAVDAVPYPVDELPESGEGGWVYVQTWNPWEDIRPARG